MAEGKKSVLLYVDLIHTVDKLTDEQAGKLFKHYLMYVNDLDPETDDQLTEIVFEPIKQQLKRDLKKWDEIREKRSIAGQKSAEMRAKKVQQVSTSVKSVEQTVTNPTVTDTVNVKVNVTDTVKKSLEDRKKTFVTHITETNNESIILGNEDLVEFLSYWTEHGLNDKKMRFEKQKSFAASRRLQTWAKNKIKFAKNEKGTKKSGAYGNFLDAEG